MKSLYKEIEEYEIETLLCYNCKDKFDPLEQLCDKCGAPRPRCIVCFLDLDVRNEEEEIIKLPCCQVYTHRDHIIIWLEKKPICPNCHNDLSDWLKLIK